MYHVGHHGVDALRVAHAEGRHHGKGQAALGDDAGPNGVFGVVVDISQEVGQPAHLSLQGVGLSPVLAEDIVLGFGVIEDAVPHFPGEVQALAVVLQVVGYSEGLLVVAESARADLIEGVLTDVSERRVAEVMPEADGLGKVLVEVQGTGDGSGDLGDLQGVRQAGHVVVTKGRDEDLRLVLEAAECLGVEDAVAVPLELSADGAGLLVAEPST